MIEKIWAAVARRLESLLLAGDRRWHGENALWFGPAEPTIEVLNPGRSWFRCLACGRAWSLEVGPLGRMPKNWFLCPGGCNLPAPDLRVVSPAE